MLSHHEAELKFWSRLATSCFDKEGTVMHRLLYLLIPLWAYMSQGAILFSTDIRLVVHVVTCWTFFAAAGGFDTATKLQLVLVICEHLWEALVAKRGELLNPTEWWEAMHVAKIFTSIASFHSKFQRENRSMCTGFIWWSLEFGDFDLVVRLAIF